MRTLARHAARPSVRASAAAAADSDTPPPLASLVEIGTFGAPHGVRGELRVFPTTDDPVARLGRGGDLTSRGRDLWLVGVAGVGDAETAASLTNHVLWIDAAERPPLPPDGDEWYVQDLVGATAVSAADGGTVGAVVDVVVGGGGGGADLIRIALPPAADDDDAATIIEPATVLLPFTKEFVPSVDAAARVVVVAPPAGLLDAATKPRRASDAAAGGRGRPKSTRRARDAGARSARAAGGKDC